MSKQPQEELPFVPLSPQVERARRKEALFAAAHRWATRLPGERGEDHRRTYDRMMANFLGALRA